MKPQRFNGVGPRGMSCYIPVHVGADCGQPDAVGRPAQAREDAAESLAGRCGGRASGEPQYGPAAARRTNWVERDRALILTALLAGPRVDELLRANVGDLRRSDDGAVIHVRGKGARTAGSQSNRRRWKFSSAIWVAGRPASLQPSDSAPPAGDWRSGRLLRRPDSPAIRRPTNGSRPGA